MFQTTKSYYKAIAALAGTTIGAGIFGIPYVMSQVGIGMGVLWVVGIGAILVITNLLHGEVSLRTRDDKQFVGTAKRYLPNWADRIIGPFTIVNFSGSLLAYLIIGGSFLQTLISVFYPVDTFTATIIYFILTALILIGGLSFLERVDFPAVILLVAAIIGLAIIGLPKISIDHFAMPRIDFLTFLLPYGVIMFALNSLSAIPSIEEMMDKSKKKLKRAIIWAGVIAITITIIFGVTVAGISGPGTTQDAISGLSGHFGDSIIVIGAIIGFLAIITSHLIIGHHLKEVYVDDYNRSRFTGWALAVGVPLVVFLLGVKSFIAVIAFVGAVLTGLHGVFVSWMSLRSHEMKTRQPEYCLTHDRFWAKVVIVLFSLGVVYQIANTIYCLACA